MIRELLLGAALLVTGVPGVSRGEGPTLTPDQYREDARSLDALIVANYGYLDRFPGGAAPASAALAAEREAVHDRDSLLHYAEDRIASLADHHAITGGSFRDSWGLVPTFADLWIVADGDSYRIDAVRPDTPAQAAGIKAGDRLVSVDNQPAASAVAAFLSSLGIQPVADARSYAARVLAAGRRDRPRHLGIQGADGQVRELTLDNLYAHQADRPPVRTERIGNGIVIRFNNALGEAETIKAFDAAMETIAPDLPVTLDLSDTPSGGDSYVARAIMGWFVKRPSSFQVHNLPAEERETGIARQWIEQVFPRAGKYHPGRVTVRVGRWTGSMGEGIAIGFDALGFRVCGDRMAGLRGAIYDFKLPNSGMTVKFPVERLYTVAGMPRENFVPRPLRDCR